MSPPTGYFRFPWSGTKPFVFISLNQVSPGDSWNRMTKSHRPTRLFPQREPEKIPFPVTSNLDPADRKRIVEACPHPLQNRQTGSRNPRGLTVSPPELTPYSGIFCK